MMDRIKIIRIIPIFITLFCTHLKLADAADSGSAVNSMNMYVMGGVVGTIPSVAGFAAASGVGGAASIIPDICSGRLCAEMTVTGLKRRFTVNSQKINFIYVLGSPGLRFYILPIFSLGFAPYVGKRLNNKNQTLNGFTLNDVEAGGLFAARLNLNILPFPGMGLAIEFRGMASVLSQGSGARTTYRDALVLAGIRFGAF